MGSGWALGAILLHEDGEGTQSFQQRTVRAGEADLNKARLPAPADYAHLLTEIKSRTLQVQTRAIFTINARLIYL
jgi:hypothetical protein